MPPSNSVKHLECWYWRNMGHCEHDETTCLYAHHSTGQVAGKPIKREAGKPAVAGRNADAARPIYNNWQEARKNRVNEQIRRQLEDIRCKAQSSRPYFSPDQDSTLAYQQLPHLSILFTANTFAQSYLPSTSTYTSQAPPVSNDSCISYPHALASPFDLPVVRQPSNDSNFDAVSTAPMIQIPANTWRPMTSAGPSKWPTTSNVANESGLEHAPPPMDPSRLTINTGGLPGPSLPPRVPEPWAAKVEQTYARLLHSSHEIFNGYRLFDISKEEIGPGTRFMVNELEKHISLLMDVLYDMSVVLGRPIDVKKEGQ